MFSIMSIVTNVTVNEKKVIRKKMQQLLCVLLINNNLYIPIYCYSFYQFENINLNALKP